MKSIKRAALLALVLTLVCSLFLTGCNTANDPSETDTNTDPEGGNGQTQTDTNTDPAAGDEYTGPTGSITWCSWGSDAEIQANQQLSEAFMASHPGTTVTLETYNDDYATAVETRFLGGQSPDVIYGHPSTLLKWMQEGMLMDISDIYEENDFLWDEDHYLTDTYEAFMHDGKYFGTVAGADTFVLFYNKTLIEEAGFECPDENTTWEEIIEIAQATTVRDEAGIPSVMGLSHSYGYYNAFPIIYAYGGSVFDDMINPTEVTFYSPETVEALTFIQDSSNKYHFAPDGTDNSYMSGWFASGVCTFHISGVYDIVYMTGIEDFEWDIAPLPNTMNTKGDTAVLYAGYAVSSQTENPELVKEFVLWLTSDEAQMILASTGIFTPANKVAALADETLNIPGAPEHHSLRVENIPYGQSLQGQVLCWNEMMSVYDVYINQLYNGEITPDDCAKALQTEWEALFEAEMNAQ